jgi:hypothetical protein
MDVEDKIVNACAAESNSLALACEIASLGVRWYDDEVPEGASVHLVTKRDRTQLEGLLDQVPRSLDDHIRAAQIFGELAPLVTADEFSLAARKALNYFRHQPGIRK